MIFVVTPIPLEGFL
ncbi:hypothetical protein MTR67_025835 [Solanum verrucosum]|uniref:Uncharacterized protein n=1 Tax=Solanum verrucosum TaxID=315347 RepID=A0AAF0R102_SOLVR|nr:hypothetical protein MTR67_025835 [Solanum verrucosum]